MNFILKNGKFMKAKAILVKAFTKDKSQGNPAGVVFDTDNLSDDQMIKISAELGFSESAFVQKSEKADFRLRFFTATQEVDLCGHATIATIHALRKEVKMSGELINIETKAGVLPIEYREDGLIVMTQAEPQFGGSDHNRKEIARLLNISETEILDYPIKIVSTGTPKLIIAVNSLNTLFKINPDLEGIKKYCREHAAKGFYPFTFETMEKESDFHARQFNPLAGINEDPITGVAAGALGAYVVRHKLMDKSNFVIEQGYCMNKGGKIFVSIDDSVKVGGFAIRFGEKVLEI